MIVVAIVFSIVWAVVSHFKHKNLAKIAKKDANIHSIADTPEWTGWGQSRLPPR